MASSSLGTAYTPTIQVNYTALSHRPHVNQGNLREFFSKTWDYLRAAHRLNVDRRTGLCVCANASVLRGTSGACRWALS